MVDASGREQKSFHIEKVEWSEDMEEDPNKPHCHRTAETRYVVLNNRLYIF